MQQLSIVQRPLELIDTPRVAPVDVVPEGDRSPDEWADWCNEPRGRAVESILEWGRRIQSAHDAYRAQPQRWGQTWDDWCQQRLSIGKRSADRLRTISRNLGHTVSQILPTDQQALYSLARLRQADPDAFERAVGNGTIRPDMDRREAQQLLKAETGPAVPTAALTGALSATEGMAWQLGNHRLYCADSSVWRPPLDAPARMAFADPPYGLTTAAWDSELCWEHDWLQDWADVVAVTPGIRNAHRWPALTTMRYHWTLTYWMSNSMTHGPVGYANVQHVWLYSRLDSVHVGKSDFGKGAVDPTEGRGHRGQKPTALLVWLMELLTNPGDWVIDPFAGSGTTVLAAEKTGRRCIAVEKESRHCEQIVSAWEQQTSQRAIAISR